MATNKSGPSKDEEENADGCVKLRNPHIALMDQDYLYHLALGTACNNLYEMFHDVKFVCIGGTPHRMEQFAHFIMKEIGYTLPAGAQLQDISALSHRYALYKVGPVLSVSHGMGIPSVSILMHELIKLMYYAKCQDPIFFRLGTCGGLGVEGGTVIITDDALDAQCRNFQEFCILGKVINRPAKLDRKVAQDLKALASPNDPFETVIGKTLCTNDFYEGQGRLDGAFCDYAECDKLKYLQTLRANGVVNIEMESTVFAALTYHAGIKAAVVCVALLNRLNGDQISTPAEVMLEWQGRPQILVSRYIRKIIAEKKLLPGSSPKDAKLGK